MNAPAETHLEPATLDLLPLVAIAPSETAMQAERRRTYGKPELEDLAASIRETGLAQPILVRPLAAMRGLAQYELVAGERRWLACEFAGLAHVPAVIRALTDEQVVCLQLVENLQRQQLDTLAEARGYRELIDGGMRAEVIGTAIGKSKSYVYARVKLLEICPAVQEALAKGEIATEQALLFARIPTAKLQELGLETLRKWDYQGHGERLSFRRTAEILQNKGKGFLIPLAQVPFQLDDASYHTFGPKQGPHQAQDVVDLPACTVCPKRSGNDPELLEALRSADICTDRGCHDAKAKQEFERRRKNAEASGREVLTGDAAAAIAPTNFGTRGYIDLDDECGADEFPEPEPEDFDSPEHDAWERASENWQPRTYRQLLGADAAALEVQLIQDPKHKSRLRELAPDKAVAKLLREKGVKVRIRRDDREPAKPEKPKDPETARRAAEKAAAEQAAQEIENTIDDTYTERLLAAVHKAWKGPLKRDELELVAEYLLGDWDLKASIQPLYPKLPTPATLNERELGRLIVVGILAARLKGCTNCYAMRQAHRQSGPGRAYEGLTQMSKGGPVWTGQVRLVPELLEAPLHRKRPRRIFVNSMSDLFHEDVPEDFINQVFAVMALVPQHTFQVLTKRPRRMQQYLGDTRRYMINRAIGEALGVRGEEWPTEPPWPLPNVHLGVSVEDQATADERIPLLLETPAAVRWISAEPLLGPISFEGCWVQHANPAVHENWLERINWIVAGGESGPGARPIHPDWVRSLRDQCAAMGVPFFFKQWGAWLPGQNDQHPNLNHAVAHHQDGRWGPTDERMLTERNYATWDQDGKLRFGPRTAHAEYFKVEFWAERVGKRAAGRLLDGRTHDEYPR